MIETAAWFEAKERAADQIRQICRGLCVETGRYDDVVWMLSQLSVEWAVCCGSNDGDVTNVTKVWLETEYKMAQEDWEK